MLSRSSRCATGMAARRKKDPPMHWHREGYLTEQQLDAIAELFARMVAREIWHKKEEKQHEDKT